jgi:hypothetical protein
MKNHKYILILVILLTIGFTQAHAQEKSDYKVSVFYEWGWYYCALINNSNITLLCYANQNEYHKSGNPIYIIQGKIGAPDKRNTTLGDGDPTAGVVTFKALYTDPLKKDPLPYPGTIWYKNNPSGKDQLEMEAGEATLDVLIAK